MSRFNLVFFLGILFLLPNMSLAKAPSPKKIWIFFKDKPALPNNIVEYPEQFGLTKRAIQRRERLFNDSRIDYKDIPVSSRYVKQLVDLGIQIDCHSRWLNAVSAWVSPSQKVQLSHISFVDKIQQVGHLKQVPGEYSQIKKLNKVYDTSETPYDYGYSITQNEMIDIPRVHALGLTGKNIRIGIIDSGFDLTHEPVFSHLDIIDEYDFYWRDDTTRNQTGDPGSQHNHGTAILSAIAGFEEGELVGPAFNSSYLLAKTEWVSSETQLEEDLWVEAIEWMERKGVDIITSSLGYSLFQDGNSYTYEDMDGNTALTTISADIAAGKGVVVITSAGNEANDPWGYITSPADGDSVIAVGAVHQEKRRVYFSSYGPTSDGRIKPDVMAMGMGVICYSPSINGYIQASGTSLACPQVAGVCALLLEARPGLKPIQIREALRQTADRAASPDTLYGWGIVNAWDALFYYGPYLNDLWIIQTLQPSRLHVNATFQTKQGVPLSVTCFYSHSGHAFQSLPMFYEREHDGSVFQTTLPAGTDKKTLSLYFEVDDSTGTDYKLPVNAPEYAYQYDDTTDEMIPIPTDVDSSKSIVVYPNYPNPFSPSTYPTRIRFDCNDSGSLKLMVLNAGGQHVITLIDQYVAASQNIQVPWDGLNKMNQSCASGVYFAVFEFNNQIHIRKILLIH